ncbi:unnamed protein product, partial [Brenthis ino]
MSGIWSLTTLCRCCHADGTFKSLDSPHNVDNSVEIYTEMLKNTLGLFLQSPELEVSYTICDVCITQLRDAYKFKNQVLQCEEKFREYCNNELLQHMEVKMEKESDAEIIIKPEVKIKAEDVNNDNDVKKESIDTETLDITYEPENQSDDEVDATDEIPPVVENDPEQNNSQVTYSKLYRKIKTKNGFKYSCMMLTDMEKHMKSHTNKRFKCESCSRSYSERNALHRHIKQAHSGINYPCDVCGKVYVKKGSWKAHTERAHKNKVKMDEE